MFNEFRIKCIVSSGLSYCSDCDAAIDVAMLEDVKARFNLITQASQLKAPSAAPNTTSRHYRSVEQIAISVSLMGGDTEMFTLSSDLEVSRLMDQIAARFSIPKSKQRLMSSGRAIKVNIPSFHVHFPLPSIISLIPCTFSISPREAIHRW